MRYAVGDKVKLKASKIIDGTTIPATSEGTIVAVLSALDSYKVDFLEKDGVVVHDSELQ
ncbi:MAG: hypothetical protein AAGA64_11975 [Bacteroidota bacterium]